MDDHTPTPPTAEAPPLEAIEAAKQRSTLQLLFRTARMANTESITRVRSGWGVPLREAHTALFPHIDFEGTRQTTIAAALGVSKQAVGPRIDELEAWGIVERVPDPSDGRARLVRFSTRGRLAMMAGLEHLMRFEAELAAEVDAALGDGAWAALRRGVIALDDVLGRHAHGAATHSDGADEASAERPRAAAWPAVRE